MGKKSEGALVTVDMVKGRETKGTHVYKADDTAIPSLYLRKEHLTDAPEKITVTVTAG